MEEGSGFSCEVGRCDGGLSTRGRGGVLIYGPLSKILIISVAVLSA
jgi:hypothetical protein